MKNWYFPIAMLILAAFLFLFLYPANITLYRNIALNAQFSTMLAFVGRPLILALAVLVLTMLFGRLYCAYLCPAGLLQHLFTHVGRWTGLSRLSYRKAMPILSYAVVGLVAVYGIIAGSALIFGPIPGYSLLFQPVSDLFRRGYDNAGRYLVDNPVYAATVAILFVLMIIAPLFYGRVFCNRLCPVGIVLGWATFLPGRRFRIIPETCAACGQCAKVCPMGCIDAVNKTIDAEHCVECRDCMTVCKLGAVEKTWQRSSGRRSFLSAATVTALGGFFVFSKRLTQPGGLLGSASSADVPVAPAGSGGNETHKLHCIGCQGCVPVCPVGIIRPHNDGRPVLDYRYGFCQYNCNRCSRSCPTGAIQPLSRQEKQTTRLARVTLHFENCVVLTRGNHCGACAEVCPTHAVSMIQPGVEDMPPVPDFDPEYCIGCGACYHVCPATPRAFSLTGLQKQERSKGIRFADSQDTERNGEGGRGRERGDRDNEDSQNGDANALTDFPF